MAQFQEAFGDVGLPIAPLPGIQGIPEFTHRLDHESKKVLIQFPIPSARASTIFGGRINEPIVLDRFDLARLPHDLVLCCFNILEGPQDVAGRTPDMVLPREDGAPDLVELGTTRALSVMALRQLIVNKTGKYQDLIEAGYAHSVNVVAVNSRMAHDANGPLPDSDQVVLCAAYKRGRAVIEEYERTFGSLDIEEGEEAVSALRDKLTLLGNKDLELEFDLEWMPEPDTLWRVGSKSFLKDPESWDSKYLTWSQGEMDLGAVVSLPWVIPEVAGNEFKFDYPVVPGMYSKVFEGARGRLFDEARDYETLRVLSELRSGEPKPRDRDPPDTCRIHLTMTERVHLARRGVMAKELRRDEGNGLKDHLERTRTPISVMSHTGDITDFVRRAPVPLNNHPWPLGEIQHLWMESKVGTLEDQIRMILDTDDSWRVWFLELVAREIMYNMDRNPEDRGEGRQFIYRRVPGFKAFLAIRTTRMGGSDDAPCFAALMYKGPPCETTVFTETFEAGEGWRYTQFFSLTRRKAENLCGILAQHVALYGLLLDNFEKLTPETSMEDILRVSTSQKTLLLTLLEDKDHTSRNLQQLRYYYMELFSSMPDCKNRSLKILSKLDPVLRSRLLVYFIQRLRAIHESLPDDFHLRTRNPDDTEAVNQEEEETAGSRGHDVLADAEKLLLSDPIPTPFGFNIQQPEDMLLASYVCMLHNKNEQNYGHGAIQVVDKIASMQVKLRELRSLHSDEGDFEFFHKSGLNPDPDEMHLYQHSPSAVAKGAQLAIKKICEYQGWKESDFHRKSSRLALARMLRTTLLDMATTKSSTVPFDPEFEVTKDGAEHEDIGWRTKSIEQILLCLDEAVDQRVAMNLDWILDDIRSSEHGGLQVTIFRKNQIGGVREILVLTIRGRMLVRMYNDYFRELCNLHPSEILTDDSSKDRFVAEHFSTLRAQRKAGESYGTVTVSGDMTKWAPSFSLFEFHTMGKLLMPKELWAFSATVLQMHRNKMLQIPGAAIEMFLRSPDTTLSSPGADFVKECYLGLEVDPLLGAGKAAMRVKTDMLQGILHYPSSMYHVMHLEYFSELMRSWVVPRSGITSFHPSFVVSSDDEGMLLSVKGEPQSVRKSMGLMMHHFHRVKATADHLFGVRSSPEKYTISPGNLLEFNSKFYLGNTVVSPLIKFVARATDDNPAESLGRRVAALYSQLRQVRENGASGFLTHFVSACQAISFYGSLGVGTMSWYEPGSIKRLTRGLSPLGCLRIQDPLIAGLMDAVYANWLEAKSSPRARRVIGALMSYSLPSGVDDLEVSGFGLFPRRKYHRFLERVGLSGFTRSEFVREDNFREYLSGAESISTEADMIKRKALDPSLALSFSWPNRVMSIRMTPYLLWAAMWKVQGDKLGLERAAERIMESGADYDLEVLFPMWRQLTLIDSARRTEFAQLPLSRKRRLHYQWVAPFYLAGDHQAKVKEVLLEKWYGKRSSTETVRRVQALWEAIAADIPFLRESGPVETLEASPFATLDQLLSFVESYALSNKPVRLLARGTVTASGQSFMNLLRYNLCPKKHYRAISEAEMTPSEIAMMEAIEVGRGPVVDPRWARIVERVEDRTKAWYELLRRIDKEDEPPLLGLMHQDMHRYMRDQMAGSRVSLEIAMTSSTGSRRLDDLRWHFLLGYGFSDLSACWRGMENCTVWMEPESLVNDRYTGDYDVVRKRGDLVIRVTKRNRVVRAKANRPEKVVQTKLKTLVYDSLDFEFMDMPDGRCVGISNIKGSRMFVLQCVDGVTRYMSLPNAQTKVNLNMDPVRDELGSIPRFVGRWLRREVVTEQEFSEMVTLSRASPWWPVAKSIIKAAADLRAGRVVIQIQERVAALPMVQAPMGQLDEDWSNIEEELREQARDLAGDDPLFEEGGGWEEMDFGGLVMTDDGDIPALQAAGLEAFAMEEGYSMLEVNVTVRELLERFEVYSRTSLILLSPDLGELVALYRAHAGETSGRLW